MEYRPNKTYWATEFIYSRMDKLFLIGKYEKYSHQHRWALAYSPTSDYLEAMEEEIETIMGTTEVRGS